MKKVISIILSALILCSTFVGVNISAFATETKVESVSETSGDFKYELLDNDTAEITSYIGSEIDVTIPSTIDGYTVTSIGHWAFKWRNITSVTIPDSVTSIGEGAFEECYSLASITIPDSVTSIGESAFYYCENLTSITIPESVTIIDCSAFSCCYGLSSITIPDSVISIASHAFSNCTNLTSVIIPDGVTSIGDNAFNDCKNLTSIIIPDSVISIGYDAFCYTGYYFDDSNWKNDVLYINNHLITANDCISGEYTIKEGTKTIADYAFRLCEYLTNISIPNSVKSIGEDAFYNCRSLRSVTIGDGVTSIRRNAFYGTGLTSAIIPDGVTSIDDSVFYDCTNLTSITIPNSVTSIGGNAFACCISLTNVTIPDSVTIIGEEAFSNCGNLTSVEIGDGVTSIGKDAFYYCEKLKSVTIGDSVTSIGRNAFYCTRLTNVYISDVEAWCNIDYFNLSSNPLYFADNLYLNNELVKNIVIPDGVTTIPSLAFCCTSLESIIIPDSVTSISEGAVGYCNYDSDGFEKIDGFVIYGYESSVAETYAIENGFKFVALGGEVIEPSESIQPTETESGESGDTTPTATEPSESVVPGESESTNPSESTQPTMTEPSESTSPTVTEPSESVKPSVTEPSESTKPDTKKPVAKKTTINLKKTSAKLYLKDSTTIKTTVENGKGKTSYTSSNKKIAKVNSNGKVVAKGVGTVKITVENNGVKKIFKVTVKKPTLNKKNVTLKKNKSATLKITGKVGKATFISSNKKIAKVNSNGKVVAKKKGKAIITVKTNGIKLKCKITVK